jgi:hypothetical protein
MKMNRQSPHIDLTVQDWPLIGKTIQISVDAGLHPTMESMRDWLAEMYGPGRLTKRRGGEFLYERRVRGPLGLWRLLLRILNKSY